MQAMLFSLLITIWKKGREGRFTAKERSIFFFCKVPDSKYFRHRSQVDSLAADRCYNWSAKVTTGCQWMKCILIKLYLQKRCWERFSPKAIDCWLWVWSECYKVIPLPEEQLVCSGTGEFMFFKDVALDTSTVVQRKVLWLYRHKHTPWV